MATLSFVVEAGILNRRAVRRFLNSLSFVLEKKTEATCKITENKCFLGSEFLILVKCDSNDLAIRIYNSLKQKFEFDKT